MGKKILKQVGKVSWQKLHSNFIAPGKLCCVGDRAVIVRSSDMPQSDFCNAAKASWWICQELHTSGWQCYCLELASCDL